MPIYDYACSSCGNRTEFIHAIDAPAPRYCPVCGTEDSLRKVFVAPTVVFKGSGWAKKDRSSSSRHRAGGDRGASTGGKDAGSGEGGGSTGAAKGDAGKGGDATPGSAGASGTAGTSSEA